MRKRWLNLLVAGAVGASMLAPSSQAEATQPMKLDVYTQPGDHYSGGRYWRTSCEMYSSTVVRCRTDIYATKVERTNAGFTIRNDYVFNNLTYLPAPRSVWKNNNLARNASWRASDGRQWRTECDTSTTGRHGCRSYTLSTLPTYENGRYVMRQRWVFNNIVRFSHSALAPQTSIPPRSPRIPNMPKPTAPKLIGNPSGGNKTGFQPDSRCNTGRALCVSKKQRKMAWMVNGQVIRVFDVRFGSELTPTRNGQFKVNWKSRNHVSGLYHTPMPFALFFSGGQAIHYSPDFARRGYNGASHGCVNVRDYNGIKWLFDTQVRTGDKVIVYK